MNLLLHSAGSNTGGVYGIQANYVQRDYLVKQYRSWLYYDIIVKKTGMKG